MILEIDMFSNLYNLNIAALPVATVLIVVTVMLWITISILIGYLKRKDHPLVVTLNATRNYLLPTAIILFAIIFIWNFPLESKLVKITQTILGIEIIWILLSLTKVILFTEASDETWRSRVPGLLVDIGRFAFVVVGAAMVISMVWDKNFGGFLATLGIGSIVLGLALQDTLGSVMAGIALLFEKPFYVSDWIKVGDLTGKVTEINWRSVRLLTRDMDNIIVPNSVLGKERIQNFSRPSAVHGMCMYVGFSYNDPPNKVKHILMQTALATKGVLSRPEPSIRVKGYNDSSINYEIRFFITEFHRLPEIESDFMTKIWYAARRNSLTIPFPIRTVYKTEVPFKVNNNPIDAVRVALQSVPLFSTLSPEELEELARDSTIQNFARGEEVVSQGDPGDALYIMKDGLAQVLYDDSTGERKEVARLKRNDFFGEMSLLSGEPRMSSVVVLEDAELVVVYKEALATLLERRADLAHELAELADRRRQELVDAKTGLESADVGIGGASEDNAKVLVEKIKNFFGL